ARFGRILVPAGFLGTLLGGRLSDALTRRLPGAHFVLSGVSLVVSIAFTLPAVLASSPAIYWPATFVTLLLLFINIGPLNAAMANVLPADLRARGFAVTTGVMHLFGDAASPWLIGVASDAVGLTVPVLVTGSLLVVAGIVLLVDRASLVRDMRAVGATPAAFWSARPQPRSESHHGSFRRGARNPLIPLESRFGIEFALSSGHGRRRY